MLPSPTFHMYSIIVLLMLQTICEVQSTYEKKLFKLPCTLDWIFIRFGTIYDKTISK